MTGEVRSAIVIGAGIGGLAAAAYLARAGVRTTVFETRPIVGGAAETAMLGETFRVPLAAHAFYALDRRMVRDLALYRHGLALAARDMPLVALHPGGRHLVLPRGAFGARAAIAAATTADADAYRKYRRELFALANAMRPLWLAEGNVPTNGARDGLAAAIAACALSRANQERLAECVRTSAAAYLDRWFEGEALKAALAFDVCLHGVSPREPGSALLLVWRAAQEVGGLRNATVQIKGGPLTLAVALTAVAQEAGALVQTGARVTRILYEDGRAAGVGTSDGEKHYASAVISNLGRLSTLSLLPPSAVPLGTLHNGAGPAVGSAKVLLALNGPVPVAGLNAAAERGRLVIAARPESTAEAKGAALAGQIPEELVIEVTIPSSVDSAAAPVGQSVLSALVLFLPLEIEGGWEAQRTKLLRRTIAALEAYAPGIGDRVIDNVVLTPADALSRYESDVAEAPFLARLLSTAETRSRLPARGVYLCGAAAEPVDAVSGAAGRVAAQLALRDLPASKDDKREPD